MIEKIANAIAKFFKWLNKLANALTTIITAYNDYMERKDEIRAKVMLALKITTIVLLSCGTALVVFIIVKIIKAITKKIKKKKAQKQLEAVQELEA